VATHIKEFGFLIFMSTIRLLVVKGNTMYAQDCPWRTVLKFLDHNEETQTRFLRLMHAKDYLDGGYFLLDMDNKILLTSQSVFTLQDIKPSRRRKYGDWMMWENI